MKSIIVLCVIFISLANQFGEAKPYGDAKSPDNIHPGLMRPQDIERLMGKELTSLYPGLARSLGVEGPMTKGITVAEPLPALKPPSVTETANVARSMTVAGPFTGLNPNNPSNISVPNMNNYLLFNYKPYGIHYGDNIEDNSDHYSTNDIDRDNNDGDEYYDNDNSEEAYDDDDTEEDSDDESNSSENKQFEKFLNIFLKAINE